VIVVAGVVGFAQLIEGMILTPRCVGERIGLHPVAVLFAVMAGAQLFGFIGVLLALPVAAVVMVLLRHTHKHYISSELYSADQEQAKKQG
jgi:predicted PurR-regulated permease PerM